MKIKKTQLKSVIREEIENIFEEPKPKLLTIQCPRDPKNVFSKTSQNSKKVEGSTFNTEEGKRFALLYEIALTLQKKNLAALYFLEGFQRLVYYVQFGKIEEGKRRKEHLEQLIPYFVKAKGNDLFVITELSEEEDYWVRLLHYNFTNSLEHNMANPHAFVHMLPQRNQ